jgi:hypothetical protein
MSNIKKNDIDEKLRNFSLYWKLDSDMLICNECLNSIKASEMNKRFIHSETCKSTVDFPWFLLITIIDKR